uniref:CCHC-type domain-containing protein n=1 Tax=Tanacetum cinerariifolium TaxID=118510 RepID=A0A6L2JDL1_TANCI|nr:hypothetical protein [Tanacetum cinerariifolium]
MSTQQDIYAAASESRPPMLNKENYVPWSSRVLRYAKSRPNGKLIHNSIINGPYVRRMIPEPGDINREVPVNETFHVQTDDELTEKELKQIEVDDQAIQTILLDLPEDIYAAIDSCEIAQEIWLRVQQMMKGSDIGIQEKKTKLFNEWERFTSNEWESIESYYYRFLELMTDLKRNKHFSEKIASNLKFLNNLQPKWIRHVTIVYQTKDLYTAGYTQLYDFLKYNQKKNVGNLNGYNAVQNVRNQVAQNPRVQNVRNQNGLIGVPGNVNHNRNGNLVAARAEGNATGHNVDLDEIEEVNANCILMANLQQASTSVLRLTKLPSMIQTDQLRMTLETHNWSSFAHQELHKIVKDEIFPIVNQVDARVRNFEIQFLKEAAKFVGNFKSLAKEADESLAKHKALELEIKRLLRAVDKAYKDMQQKIELLQAQLGDPKGKSKDTSCLSDTRNPLYHKLGNENVELEFQILNYAKENAHCKTTYKNLFDSIYVSRTQAKTIIAFMQHELQNTIYENAKLRAQLFKKVSVKKDNTRGTSTNTKFAKQSILGKPPMLGEIHALSKPITSNLVSTPQESKVVKNDKNVISKVVYAMCKQCLIFVNHDVCLRNYVNGKTSRGKKQKAKVSIKKKQKKHQPKVKKTKKVGFIERLATPKPSKTRFFLRWSPTGRLFDLKSKIIKSSESESQYDCSNGDNACISNTMEPKIKRFPNSTSLLGRNDHVAAILGFGDLQWGNILITRVYFVEGLGHNLFSVRLLCLPKFKYHKEHLCPSCEQGKSKRASHPQKPVLNSRQRLHLLHMDLCGPLRIASTVMSDSEDSTVTYTKVSSPFEGLSDIRSLGVDGLPMIPEDPYAYVVAALQAPTSPNYVPSHVHPPLPAYAPEFVREHVYLEFMPPEEDVLLAEEQPLSAAISPTTDLPGYITDSDLEKDPEEDPADYPANGGDDDDGNESSNNDEDDEDDVRRMRRRRISTQLQPTLSHHHLYIILQLGYLSQFRHLHHFGLRQRLTDFFPYHHLYHHHFLHGHHHYPRFPYHHYRAAMIKPRAEAPSTSYSLPSSAPPLGTPPLLPIHLPTLSPPLLLPSTSHRVDVHEVTLPPRKRLCISLGPRFEVGESSFAATARPTGDTWDEMLMGMPGASTTDETELGWTMTDFVTIIRQDTNEIYRRLDDAEDDKVVSTAVRDYRIMGSRPYMTDTASRGTDPAKDTTDIDGSITETTRGSAHPKALEDAGFRKWHQKTTRSTPATTTTTTTTTVTDAQLKALIDQGIANALAARNADRSRNGEDSHDSGMGVRRTSSSCSMFPKESDKIERYIDGFPDMIYGSVMASNPKTMQDNTGRAYTVGSSEKKPYGGSKPLCSKCNYHHDGQCAPKCPKCNTIGHLARDCRSAANANTANNQTGTGAGQKPTCFECGAQGHFKRECPKLNKNNRGNPARNENAPAIVYTVGYAGTNPDSNHVTGTFLLNNRYASILFDTGADRSFVSTAFSSQIDVTPTTLDYYYDVKLADGRIIGLYTIIRGFTINFLNHPFNIDLMPVELGSFDVIIGMDWWAKYQAVIVCAKKIVSIPWGNETLIVHRDESNLGNETHLNIISCTKTQKYMLKGCHDSLARVTIKETKDKLEKKQLENVSIVQDFLKELSDKGFIRPSSSTWGAPVLFFKKKDESFRMCIDYQELNKLTVKNRYLLLRIDDLFDQLQGSSVYSKNDLRSAIISYDFVKKTLQIPLSELNKEEHEEHLKLILEFLRKKELYAKFSKYEFWILNVQFLSHVIDSQVIHVDLAKIESIKDWASPKTPT